MSNLLFVAQFIASKSGLNGLSPTWDIDRITRSDGTRSALVTGGATNVTFGRRGEYGYLLADADLKLYAYVACAITTDATVDQKEIAAFGDIIEADVLKLSGDGTAADNAESFFDGTGYAGTNNVIPTVTTVSSGSVNSVTGTVSANLVEMNGDNDPVDNLVLSLGAGGLVEKLNSMLEAAGLAYRFTAAALAEGPTESGSGTGTYTDTIKDPGGNPLDGVCVQLSTDAAGAHRVYEAFTNALGVFSMTPDPGTYYRWVDLAGYTDRLTQGAQVTVT